MNTLSGDCIEEGLSAQVFSSAYVGGNVIRKRYNRKI